MYKPLASMAMEVMSIDIMPKVRFSWPRANLGRERRGRDEAGDAEDPGGKWSAVAKVSSADVTSRQAL